MNKSAVWLTTVFILVIGAGSVFGQSEEARRHFDYGEAAVKIKDYEAAIKEFEQAARLAPNWPDVFYDLGLAQEGANKYGDAVKSYREYLRLAPNANDAEEVKSLINKLEYMAIPVPEIAKGFMGIPWGASQEQITEAMTGQGYQRKSNSTSNCLVFWGDFIGAPFEVSLLLKDGSFYSAHILALIRSASPQVAYATFEQKFNELSEGYGQPKSHVSKQGRLNSGVKYTDEIAVWSPVDERTSDEYAIVLHFFVSWFTDREGDQYIVDMDNIALSLQERLDKKDTGISTGNFNDKKPSETSPPVHADDLYVIGNNKGALERFIAAGGDINAKGELGNTPLHWAANKDMAELLIAKGADINAKNNNGSTPLHWAVANGNADVAELLIAKGANINAEDNYGFTPLRRAEFAVRLSLGKKNMVDLLKKHGAR
jgi:tetratricopeptide (TPR) repeat protein